MNYIGEHIAPGIIGHILVLISFVAAIYSLITYSIGYQKSTFETGWKLQARLGFFVHGAALFGIIGLIFYLMTKEYYEYFYVWQHVNAELPYKYIFSAFWEGQEGSFLLWMFWHVILGFVVIWKGSKWEGGVLATISSVQIILVSMILGTYFDIGSIDFKLGVSPFTMLRNEQAGPIFNNPEYLTFIKGTGLNPLLQNYWMTIHPPTLFLGFASTLLPFSFAVAGFWKKDFTGWIQPALKWALFSGGILGLGILMGGAWAYEALSFGGYWAWDPVENMSLVPWLIMIGGIHTLLIAKATGRSIGTSYLFLAASFILVLYSTFLTRSGILGDTSVHAFTELGLEWQLVFFVVFYTIASLVQYFINLGSIPTIQGEESVYSREFWMFIGALVLVFSSVLMSFTTSIPVYNKLFEYLDLTQFIKTAPEDPIAHHNKFQMWIGVLIGLLSGLSQLLRFKEFNGKAKLTKIGVKIGLATLVSLVMTFITSLWIKNMDTWYFWILAFSAFFTMYLNIDYIIAFYKQNKKAWSSTLSHLGFGIMIIGIMSSGLDKKIISKSFQSSGIIEGLDGDEVNNNLLLFKNMPALMDDYRLTYLSDTIEGHVRTFNVNYERLDDKKQVVEQFELHPNILYNKQKTKIDASNPSTKHYLHKDVFTHISALPIKDLAPADLVDTLQYDTHLVHIGDTIELDKTFIVIKNLNTDPEHKMLPPFNEVAASLQLMVTKKDGSAVHFVEPIYYIMKRSEHEIPVDIAKLNLRLKFSKILPASNQFELKVNQKLPNSEYIVLEAIVFPGINLFWLGTLLMLVGLFVGLINKRTSKKMTN